MLEAGKYTVTYTITTDGNKGTQSETRSTNCTAVKGGEQTITIDVGFEKVSGQVITTAKISNVTIKKNEVESDYTPYAIGFGATAGAILVGAIVVFVLDKKGVLKKRK